MDAVTLCEIIEKNRRLDAEMRSDLQAFNRGLLSVEEAAKRGSMRQFERLCLRLRVAMPGKAPFDTVSRARVLTLISGPAPVSYRQRVN